MSALIHALNHGHARMCPSISHVSFGRWLCTYLPCVSSYPPPNAHLHSFVMRTPCTHLPLLQVPPMSQMRIHIIIVIIIIIISIIIIIIIIIPLSLLVVVLLLL
jgi:hypothetical protein